MSGSSELASHYLHVLETYMLDPQEHALENAYHFGREALQHGIGLLEVAGIHRDALLGKLRGANGISLQLAEKASVFFQECLAPFEMTQRGFQEANEALQSDLIRIRQAEDALRKAHDELQAANQELEAFSYSVSHDLRGPLRSIDGFSLAILEDYNEVLDQQGRDYLQRVRAACQRMAQLIDDLLKLSRLSRSEMTITTVNLSSLVNGLAEELCATDPNRQATFKIAEDLSVQGDVGLLRAALENLLNNAWKYTSPKPQTYIEFGSMQQSDETVYFIRDNGVGFDMTYADKLFAPFQRLHRAEEFPGAGIGLATVQRIIRRHGGHIWVEAAENEGATFYFTIRKTENHG